MKRILLGLLFFSSLLPALKAQTVVSIHIDATINPSTAEFIHHAIAKAENKKAECLIIHLNTPGGLLKSTSNIVGDIMESSVPVVVYISPAGADAG
jgi:membrane-bound serine protease (ClpP class)